MYNIFGTFFREVLNSDISHNFYNIEKFTHKCQNCPNLYFFRYCIILKFDIEQFRIYRDQYYIKRFGKNQYRRSFNVILEAFKQNVQYVEIKIELMKKQLCQLQIF